ncbi:LOG family protein [Nesterenkonia flava]|uniref:Cytokinin riboside 5'-monophosphate phosphoribohydrolase n=1 Tax=Nesterenkonia flava TaxID=469799 RepID=A0ABU1FR19_9MICC|nr:TIGR00730 family Rossman fold protein [Nesterenkonia flava]MDR5711090.1 TIGR00730 family Rossman fold protein [Nesterenkonia flava]
MTNLTQLSIFTGGASGHDLTYQREVRRFGAAVAQAGIGIVYGGGKVGLMGQVADAALEAGGEVTGIIPEVLTEREVAHQGLTHLEVVPDMHTRKARLGELGDAFVTLPGGMGTLEELFEVWTWQYLGIYAKPVALYNTKGFWNPLLKMIDHQVAEGFIAGWRRDALVIADTPEDLLDQLRAWEPPAQDP